MSGGFADSNPAAQISRIKRRVDGRKPWPDWAFDLVPQMRDEIATAVRLGRYTGQRLSDVLAMRLADIRDGRVRVVQHKTRKDLSIRVHKNLVPVVDGARAAGRIYLVSREDGRPFTAEQFQAMWSREMDKPEIGRIRREGFSFHGLRKNAVNALLEAGCTPSEAAAITGQTLAMVEHYAKGINQVKMADRAMAKWEGDGT